MSDAALTKLLAGYAGLVHQVLGDPQRWLGLDGDPPPTARLPMRIADAARDRALGRRSPASSDWDSQPLRRRVNWWLRRIAISAGLAAAGPRLAGALASKTPLQAALGASASGLAVCATAREHGVTRGEAWVPLLAEVLVDKTITPRHVPLPSSRRAEATLASAGATTGDADPASTSAAATSGDHPANRASIGRSPRGSRGPAGGARQATGTMWELARALHEISSLLDRRPRGPRLYRTVALLPVVGATAGGLDERGAIRRASRQTSKLLNP